MERTMLEEIRKHEEGHVQITVYVNCIRCLEYNDRRQAYFHVYVNDGKEMMDLPLKDARINMAREKFEHRVATIIVGYDCGHPYIAKIEACDGVPAEEFGEMVKMVPENENVEARRTRLQDAKNFEGHNFTVPVLITGVTVKTAKNGDTYCSVSVTDGESKASYNWWNVNGDEIKEQYLGTVVYLTIRMEQYPKVIRAEGCGDYEVGSFVPTAPLSPDTMYQEIMEALSGMKSTVAPVVQKIYEDNKDKLLRWAGAAKLHHSVSGGLLYHTYRMAQAAEHICQVYPGINRELLLLGVIAHDIGKLRELDTDEMGVTQFMPDGNLEGHILLGIEMLVEAAYSLEAQGKSADGEKKNTTLDTEEFRLLKHMVAAHHGKQEWGSPVVPVIPEAMVLNFLDMLDSRMDMFETALKGLEEGCISDAVYTLDGAHVYKPKKETPAVPEENQH